MNHRDFPLRFITDDRYYNINLYQDLFGDWVVVCDYGGRKTAVDRRKIIAVPDKVSGLKMVDQIAHVRHRHGYVEIQ